jgi:hypothetical protein
VELTLEERLRNRREKRADDRTDDRRENEEGQLQGFVCKVRREQAEVGFAPQKEARYAEYDDECGAQDNL